MCYTFSIGNTSEHDNGDRKLIHMESFNVFDYESLAKERVNSDVVK